MEKLEKVLNDGRTINELKKALIRWNWSVNNKVVFTQNIEKLGKFHINLNGILIMVRLADVEKQKSIADTMNNLLDWSVEKESFGEIIQKIEFYEGEECKEYRKIAEALGEDVEPYGEA